MGAADSVIISPFFKAISFVLAAAVPGSYYFIRHSWLRALSKARRHHYDFAMICILVFNLFLVFSVKNYLHIVPSVFIFLVPAIALVTASHYMLQNKKEFVSLTLFCVGFFFFMFSVGASVSEAVVYKSLSGVVEGGSYVRVYATNASNSFLKSALTDGGGNYRFLLTDEEMELVGEVRALENRRNDRNWVFINWGSDVDAYNAQPISTN